MGFIDKYMPEYKQQKTSSAPAPSIDQQKGKFYAKYMSDNQPKVETEYDKKLKEYNAAKAKGDIDLSDFDPIGKLTAIQDLITGKRKIISKPKQEPSVLDNIGYVYGKYATGVLKPFEETAKTLFDVAVKKPTEAATGQNLSANVPKPISEQVNTALENEFQPSETTKKVGNIANVTGQVAGNLAEMYVPYEVAGNVLGKVPAIAKISKAFTNPVVGRIVQNAVSGAIANLAISTPQIIYKDVQGKKDVNTILKDVAADAGINTLADVAFGGLGELVSVKNAVKNFNAGKITDNELQDVIGKEASARLQTKQSESSNKVLGASDEQELPKQQDIANNVATSDNGLQHADNSFEQTIPNQYETPAQTSLGVDKTKYIAKDVSPDKDMVLTIKNPSLKSSANEILEKNQKQSLFYNNTLKNALEPEQYDLIPENMKTYDVANNKINLETAYKNVDNKGIDTVKEELSKTDAFNAVNTDETMIVAKEYLKANNVGEFLDVLRANSSKFTEAGQTIQALSKWSNTTEGVTLQGLKLVDKVKAEMKAESKLRFDAKEKKADELLELFRKKGNKITAQEINQITKQPKETKDLMDKLDEFVKSGAINDAIARPYVEKALGIPSLTADDVKLIQQGMKIVNDDSISFNLRNKAQSEIYSLLANKVPVKFQDYVGSLWKTGLLTAPTTHIVNLASNTINLGMFKIKDAVQQILEIPVMSENKTKSIFWWFNKDLRNTADKAAREALPRVLESAKLNDATGLINYRQIYTKGNQNANIAAKGLQGYTNLVSKGLNAGDKPFAYTVLFDSIGMQMKAKGLTQPNEIIINKAIQDAKKATLRMDTALTKWISSGKKIPYAGRAVDVTMPFVRTPVNVAGLSVEYSPISLVDGMMKTFKRTALKGNIETDKILEKYASGLTGTAIMGLGAYLLANGMITASPSDDTDQRAFEESNGIQPYSIKVGDKYYSYSRFSPVGSVLAAGAEAYKSISNDSTAQEAFWNSSAAMMDSLFESSVFQNFKNFISGRGNSASDNAKKVAENYVTGWVPNINSKVSKVFQDKKYTTAYEPNKLLKDVQVKAGSVNGIQPKINTKGNEVPTGNIGKRILDNLILPANVTQETTNAVDNEIQRVYNATQNKEVFPRVTPKSFRFGTDYTLTPEEATQFQKTQGQKTYERLQQYMQTPVYQRAIDEYKAKYIAKIIEQAYDEAKAELIRNRGGK